MCDGPPECAHSTEDIGRLPRARGRVNAARDLRPPVQLRVVRPEIHEHDRLHLQPGPIAHRRDPLAIPVAPADPQSSPRLAHDPPAQHVVDIEPDTERELDGAAGGQARAARASSRRTSANAGGVAARWRFERR